MPTYDTHPNLGHPEVAGWVLGSLDPPDAEAFGEHLACCSQCQGAEAEFEAVARAFRYPVPDAEPPPGLEAKVLASVQHAVLTAQPDRTPAVAGIQRPVLGDRRDEGTPEPPATPAKAPPARSARWHWNARLLSLATAVAAVIAGAIFFGTQLLSSAAPAIAISLHAQPGFTGSGLATPHHTEAGWSVNLTVAHLKVLPPGQFYECWYAGPGNRPGHPNLITAGTFVVGQSAGGTFTMWSAADPAKFKIMQITAEQPGDAGQHGQVILSGSVKPPRTRIS